MATTPANITITFNLTGESFTGTPAAAASWAADQFLPHETGSILTRFVDALGRGQATDADATYLGLVVSA